MRARITLGHGNIIKETEKAICFDFHLGGYTWMPKSQIELDIDEHPASVGALTMPIWLAKQKGLWGYNCFGDPVCLLVQ